MRQFELNPEISEHEKWLESNKREGYRLDSLKDEELEFLSELVFNGSNLERARLVDIVAQNVHFDSCNLIQVRFGDAILNGSSFRKAQAKLSNFSGAGLEDADFRSAKLQDADFRGAELEDADFRGANIKKANFDGANLAGANFQGAKNFEDADFSNTDFTDVFY